ncbi:UROD/MetE-like protein [Marasmius fiardii PR-910]|nr:UROD/MetE-like protein [Marasmius fiardii PR-910]
MKGSRLSGSSSYYVHCLQNKRLIVSSSTKKNVPLIVQMARSLHVQPPFRADHVGSFLRPRPLRDLFSDLREGKCSSHDLEVPQTEAIKEVVALQQGVGIKSITDGEMRRAQFFDGVFEKLEGMVFNPRPITEFKKYIAFVAFLHANGVPAFPSFYCNGKIKRTKPFYVDNFKFLKTLVPPEDVQNIKVNMCAPTWFHQRHGSDQTYDLNVYKNDDEYFDDLGIAYQEEIKELYDLGCRHIQIDDPTFIIFCNDRTIAEMKDAGVDAQVLLDTYIRATNRCTKDRPKDLTISLHMCRGNYMGQHYFEGSYDGIADQVFHKLDVDAFYLEYDDERSGTFAPLKHVPRNKTVVLGLVTTKRDELETVEGLKARVDEAATAMAQSGVRSKEEALNQLCISTQCGFASTWEGNPISEEAQKQKLALLVEAAKQIWPE